VSGRSLLRFPSDRSGLLARVGADLLGDLLGGIEHARHTVTERRMRLATLVPLVCAYRAARFGLSPA
jgi:hypothetical protein